MDDRLSNSRLSLTIHVTMSKIKTNKTVLRRRKIKFKNILRSLIQVRGKEASPNFASNKKRI